MIENGFGFSLRASFQSEQINLFWGQLPLKLSYRDPQRQYKCLHECVCVCAFKELEHKVGVVKVE